MTDKKNKKLVIDYLNILTMLNLIKLIKKNFNFIRKNNNYLCKFLR